MEIDQVLKILGVAVGGTVLLVLALVVFVSGFGKVISLLEKLEAYAEPYIPKKTINGVRAVAVRLPDGSPAPLPTPEVASAHKAGSHSYSMAFLWAFMAAFHEEAVYLAFVPLYLLLGYGVRHHSRAAAISAILLTLFGVAVSATKSWIMPIAFLFFLPKLFVGAKDLIRYHRDGGATHA